MQLCRSRQGLLPAHGAVGPLRRCLLLLPPRRPPPPLRERRLCWWCRAAAADRLREHLEAMLVRRAPASDSSCAAGWWGRAERARLVLGWARLRA